jgi:hypothetical protein
MVNAVSRVDGDNGADFLSFAVPTARGSPSSRRSSAILVRSLIEKATELRKSWGPGPGSNRRPSAFQMEIDYRGAFRFDTEFDESIALLAGSAALDPVITHTFDLADAVAAMDAATDPAISSKVTLCLSND